MQVDARARMRVRLDGVAGQAFLLQPVLVVALALRGPQGAVCGRLGR